MDPVYDLWADRLPSGVTGRTIRTARFDQTRYPMEPKTMLKFALLALCAGCSAAAPSASFATDQPTKPASSAALVQGADATTAEPTILEQLAWLAGTWRMGRPTGFVEETWIPAAGGGMLGVGRTISDGRMVSFEFVRIEQRGDRLVYIAQPGGRSGTEFEMADQSADHVLFENPEHDFPKWVLYERRTDGTVMATVGDDAGQLEFDYSPWP